MDDRINRIMARFLPKLIETVAEELGAEAPAAQAPGAAAVDFTDVAVAYIDIQGGIKPIRGAVDEGAILLSTSDLIQCVQGLEATLEAIKNIQPAPPTPDQAEAEEELLPFPSGADALTAEAMPSTVLDSTAE